VRKLGCGRPGRNIQAAMDPAENYCFADRRPSESILLIAVATVRFRTASHAVPWRNGETQLILVREKTDPHRGVPPSDICDSMARHGDSHGGGHGMETALKVIGTSYTSGALRALAVKCRDGARVRHVLAMVLDGRPRGEAASSKTWTGKPCATGSIVATRRVSRACSRAGRLVVRHF
jgi:hypothetical protein